MPVYSYQTKKGKRYRVAFSYVDSFGTARQYHKRGFTSAEEAKRHEAKARLINSTSSSEITLAAAIDHYLDYKETRVLARTVADYQNTLNKHIIGFYGNIKMKNINVHAIERFQKDLIESELSERMIVHVQTEFKSFLKFCYQREYITRNPFDSLDFVHKNKSKVVMQYYTKDEYKKFR
jgi:hypothetical protein